MAVIIKHKESGEEFIVIGSGFAATDYAGKTKIEPNENEKERYPLLCVCNKKGNIGWVYSEDYKVVLVDGETPEDIYEPRIKHVHVLEDDDDD